MNGLALEMWHLPCRSTCGASGWKWVKVFQKWREEDLARTHPQFERQAVFAVPRIQRKEYATSKAIVPVESGRCRTRLDGMVVEIILNRYWRTSMSTGEVEGAARRHSVRAVGACTELCSKLWHGRMFKAVGSWRLRHGWRSSLVGL